MYNCLSLQPDLKNTAREKEKSEERKAGMLTKDKEIEVNSGAFLLTKIGTVL